MPTRDLAGHWPVWAPIRTLGPRHRPAISRHLLALDTEARARRFGCLATDDRVCRYVAQIDFDRDTVFAVHERQGDVGALVHLAFAREASTRSGAVEFGISVVPALRGRGLGSRLFEHAVTHARNRGMGRMVIQMARDNAAMRAIVRRAGAAISAEGPDVLAELPLPPDTLGSQMQEWMAHQATVLRGPANAWPAFEHPAFGHSER